MTNFLVKKLLPALGAGLMALSAIPALAQSDTTNPTVWNIAPLSAVSNVQVTVTANFSDNVGVTNCNLINNGGLVGPMSIAGSQSGTASLAYTFDGGSDYYYVTVECFDEAGNVGNATIQVPVRDNETVQPAPTGYAGRLVKLRCPTTGNVDVNHPCKAVYYVGIDGKRRAFPNEKVFYSWYTNFGGVVELDGPGLSAIVLGRNVTTRPGTRMVKFMSIDKVYAVARGGVLRWVKTEAVAQAMFGTNWNTKVDDVSEAFYTDFTFGADINTSVDYSASGEMGAATTIDLDRM